MNIFRTSILLHHLEALVSASPHNFARRHVVIADLRKLKDTAFGW
jgi:hypothetical protein